jgi:hypothetical protein
MDFTGADVSTQTEQVMQNMGAILEAGGSSFAEVVKCTILLTDMQHFATVNDIYAKCTLSLALHSLARPDKSSKPLTCDGAQTSRETHRLGPRLRPTVSPRARWWRLSVSPHSHRRRREPGRPAPHRVRPRIRLIGCCPRTFCPSPNDNGMLRHTQEEARRSRSRKDKT